MPVQGVKGSSALVLVVDDNQHAREMLADLLQFHGFAVEEATNGHEAVEKAERLRPAVVLMDLAMPLLDGWRATAELKSRAATRAIPVIVVTAYAPPEEEERARKAGCDALLTKPVHLHELITEIRRVLTDGPGSSSGGRS